MSPIDVATHLGIIAGGLVSVGVIWNKGIKPFIQMIKKVNKIYERVESFPDWCATVDESLSQTRQMMMEHLENHDRLVRGE